MGSSIVGSTIIRFESELPSERGEKGGGGEAGESGIPGIPEPRGGDEATETMADGLGVRESEGVT